MLKLYESITGFNILSIRTGGPVAKMLSPIINPDNLYIEGWYVEDNTSKQKLVLLSSDIREMLPQGFAINDHEVLTEAKDLVRLTDVLRINFSLHGLKVISESGKKYGKINDFAFDDSNMFIQKLYASQSVVKNLSSASLSIDRSQIIEITDKKIIIEDPSEPANAPSSSPIMAG